MTEDRHVKAWTKDVKAKFADISEVLQPLPRAKMAWRSNIAITLFSPHCWPLAFAPLVPAARWWLQPGGLGFHFLELLFFSLHSVKLSAFVLLSLSCSSCTLLTSVWNNEIANGATVLGNDIPTGMCDTIYIPKCDTNYIPKRDTIYIPKRDTIYIPKRDITENSL